MDQSGISPIGLGGHLPKGEGRGKPYQGSPAHWEGYYYSPSQGKGYFEFYYFVGEPITLGWEKLLKSNTNSIRTVDRMALLRCQSLNRESVQGLGSRTFLKRKFPSIRGKLGILGWPRRKPSTVDSILARLTSRLAGSNATDAL
jgi:hypothetical protein